ncbi:hypothetical protein AKJ57_02250 [candidate division MSBL1 archaeon SCGC-AAA259A05]|uniref:Uncharacterized protein n=1 Tax=candidate division MSBL1 archaeon SCGC-AAA259A05 TaxID=1698259 RepID=A0A133UAE7_9EURY|nr:hypothetical protein AKJ57_02250 [candidate division MSBL1 archaeon SCGC-AAA259A05]
MSLPRFPRGRVPSLHNHRGQPRPREERPSREERGDREIEKQGNGEAEGALLTLRDYARPLRPADLYVLRHVCHARLGVAAWQGPSREPGARSVGVPAAGPFFPGGRCWFAVPCHLLQVPSRPTPSPPSHRQAQVRSRRDCLRGEGDRETGETA